MNEIEILAKLVSYKSISSNSNKDIIDFIISYLEGYGIRPIIVPTDYDKNKYNLIARIDNEKINDNLAIPGLAFSGHTDVVPVDKQNWSYDPFNLTLSEGKLFGRGTSDMKGFIASCLAVVPEFRKKKLSKPIYYIFSADEELGCIGVESLVKQIGSKLPAIDMIWIGEPTNMEILASHKSILTCEIELFAKSGHSSFIPYNTSAIYLGHEVFLAIQDLQKEIRKKSKDNSFTPAFSTIHIGVFEGGQATNIIANRCRILIDIRAIPKDDPVLIYNSIEKILKKVVNRSSAKKDSASYTIKQTAHIPSFDSKKAPKALDFAKEIMKTENIQTAPYATEASTFQKYNIPCIVVGPGTGEKAHREDEFILVDDLDKSRTMFQNIITKLAI